jgi:hypothetical protein
MFADATDLKIHAKQLKPSPVENSTILTPQVIGDPVGQLEFVSNPVPHEIPWRTEDLKSKPDIYSYGIQERESYRVACTVRHRSDIEQPLNVFIQHIQCSIDNCLSDINDNTYRSTTGERLPLSQATRINSYRTQFVSSDSKVLDSPTIGHQYVCCYEKNGLTVFAKALTALARKENK